MYSRTDTFKILTFYKIWKKIQNSKGKAMETDTITQTTQIHTSLQYAYILVQHQPDTRSQHPYKSTFGTVFFPYILPCLFHVIELIWNWRLSISLFS